MNPPEKSAEESGTPTLPPVIVIGASGGGFQALSRVLGQLPNDFPAPIAIVQHRSLERPSELARLLGRKTPLPVADAADGEAPRAGHVYIADPGRHLMITDAGRFEYVDGQKIRFVRSSANPLFESAARVFGTRVIAVVLTGAGFNGTDGVQAVKAQGGIVIVQDPTSSEQPGMPRSAMGTGAVDYVLPLEFIAPLLIRLVREAQSHPHLQGRSE
jgi:two-component system chemotaxis response regulator CheB